VIKFIETESRIVVARGLGERETRSYFLMGIEFQLCKVSSRDWFHKGANIFNLPNHTLKMV
jgi:hypothetical protein